MKQQHTLTNAWHIGHLEYRATYVPTLPDCDICGGKMARMDESRHELCRLRKQRGAATPLLDATNHLCPCNDPACKALREMNYGRY